MEQSVFIRLEDISKTFPGVRALDHINLTVRHGEVHALVGENGAGKSTLIKILAGNYKPDAGGMITGFVLIGTLSLNYLAGRRGESGGKRKAK